MLTYHLQSLCGLCRAERGQGALLDELRGVAERQLCQRGGRARRAVHSFFSWRLAIGVVGKQQQAAGVLFWLGALCDEARQQAASRTQVVSNPLALGIRGRCSEAFHGR